MNVDSQLCAMTIFSAVRVDFLLYPVKNLLSGSQRGE